MTPKLNCRLKLKILIWKVLEIFSKSNREFSYFVFLLYFLISFSKLLSFVYQWTKLNKLIAPSITPKLTSETVTDQESKVAKEDRCQDYGRTAAVLVSNCAPDYGRDEHA